MREGRRIGSAAMAAVVVAGGLWAAAPTARGDEHEGAPTAELVAANTKFAIALHRELAAREGNLFHSPYSISTALAMTLAGAGGETEAEMARALRLDGVEAVHERLSALQRTIDGPAGAKRPYELNVANALWGQKDYPFKQTFLDLTARHYGAGLREIDMRDPGAPAEINAWVSEQTRGMIPAIVGELEEDDGLVVTNAIYFKGTWKTQFEKARTREEPFHLDADRTAQVKMMRRQSKEIRYAATPDFHAVSLPYTGDALSMVVIVPKQVDGAGAIERGLTAASLATTIDAMKPAFVSLGLPRFKASCELGLVAPLQKLGMRRAFDSGAADFTPMFHADRVRETLYIGDVAHKAVVDVNEEGTEAAAATAVKMKRMSRSRPPQPIQVVADRPFLILIRHDPTGSILFIGRIADPNAPEG